MDKTHTMDFSTHLTNFIHETYEIKYSKKFFYLTSNEIKVLLEDTFYRNLIKRASVRIQILSNHSGHGAISHSSRQDKPIQ